MIACRVNVDYCCAVTYFIILCRLGCEKKSLERIHKFNCWLADLYKLGFYTTESPSQTKIAIMHTPQRPQPAARGQKKSKSNKMQVTKF